MRGHTPLIAMRQGGKRPAVVWIDIDPDPIRWWRMWHEVTPAMAHVQIDPDDDAGLLDMRFITDMPVIVSGVDPDRVRAIAAACHRHEAWQVIVAIGNDGYIAFNKPDESEAVWPN